MSNSLVLFFIYEHVYSYQSYRDIMSETKINKKFFEIQRIYIKDVSFEAPNTPNVFT